MINYIRIYASMILLIFISVFNIKYKIQALKIIQFYKKPKKKKIAKLQ